MGRGVGVMWAVGITLLAPFSSVCVVTAWNFTVTTYGSSYDNQMRQAISQCFSPPLPRVFGDDMRYVIKDDVRLNPDEWWPPGPLTSNMIQAMMTVCRSNELRASTNHCINEVYLSSHGHDLQMDMALAQLPVSEAWNEAQALICMSETLTRDLPCVHHLHSTLHGCLLDFLNRSDYQRFLVCRQVDAAELCQREIYSQCSMQTALTLAQVTRKLDPALCPPLLENSPSCASGHVMSTVSRFLVLFCVLRQLWVCIFFVNVCGAGTGEDFRVVN